MELKRINKLATESELVIAKVERQKRLDHFAGLAIMGLAHKLYGGNIKEEDIAKKAYNIAEAMLKERAKK